MLKQAYTSRWRKEIQRPLIGADVHSAPQGLEPLAAARLDADVDAKQADVREHAKHGVVQVVRSRLEHQRHVVHAALSERVSKSSDPAQVALGVPGEEIVVVEHEHARAALAPHLQDLVGDVVRTSHAVFFAAGVLDVGVDAAERAVSVAAAAAHHERGGDTHVQLRLPYPLGKTDGVQIAGQRTRRRDVDALGAAVRQPADLAQRGPVLEAIAKLHQRDLAFVTHDAIDGG